MFLKFYLLSLPIFLGLDFAWLTLIAKKFYAEHLNFLISPTPNLWAAGTFYIIYLAGLTYFTILPNYSNKSLLEITLIGALFGFIAYATYDLTNLATIKNWPLIVTVVDLAWGAFVSGTVAMLTYLLAKKIGW